MKVLSIQKLCVPAEKMDLPYGGQPRSRYCLTFQIRLTVGTNVVQLGKLRPGFIPSKIQVALVVNKSQVNHSRTRLSPFWDKFN